MPAKTLLPTWQKVCLDSSIESFRNCFASFCYPFLQLKRRRPFNPVTSRILNDLTQLNGCFIDGSNSPITLPKVLAYRDLVQQLVGRDQGGGLTFLLQTANHLDGVQWVRLQGFFAASHLRCNQCRVRGKLRRIPAQSLGQLQRIEGLQFHVRCVCFWLELLGLSDRSNTRLDLCPLFTNPLPHFVLTRRNTTDQNCNANKNQTAFQNSHCAAPFATVLR